MNDQQTVANALRCLRHLQDQPSPSVAVSKATGLPPAACARILGRLERAGFVRTNADGCFFLERPVDELSPLDILDAVWETIVDFPMQMLFGPEDGIQAERTQQAVAMAQRANRYFSDGSLA